MACIIQENIKKVLKGVTVKIVKYDGEGRKKPMSFDIMKVKNEFFYDLLANNFINSKFAGNRNIALGEVKSIIAGINPEVWKNIHNDIYSSKRHNVIMNKMASVFKKGERSKTSVGSEIKMMHIALNEVLSTITSELNIETNNNLHKENSDKLKNNDGSRRITADTTAQVIGRKLIMHLGIKVNEDPITNKIKEREMGYLALRMLEEHGIININDKDNIINPGYKNDLGDKYGKNDESEIISGKTSISINTYEFIKSNKNYDKLSNKEKTELARELNELLENNNIRAIEDNFPAMFETLMASSGVSRMITPTNLEAPFTSDDIDRIIMEHEIWKERKKELREDNKKREEKGEAPLEDDLGRDPIDQITLQTKDLGRDQRSGITSRHAKIMHRLQRGEARLNPIMNKFLGAFLEALEKLEKNNMGLSPEATLRAVYKEMGFTNKDMINSIFGSFIGSTEDDFDSEMGKSVSRESPFMQLVMNHRYIINKRLKHHIGVYRTTRIEMLATMLNEQTDKHISRPMMQSAHGIKIDLDEELGRNMFAKMVLSVTSETKLTITEVENEGVNPGLDKAIDMLNDYKENDDVKLFNQLLEAFAEGQIDVDGKTYVLDFKAAGPFAQIAYLDSINDIREVNSGNKNYKVHMRTEPDASTSGAINTNMQAVGKEASTNEGIKETSQYKLLSSLGMINGIPKTLKDYYHVLLNRIKKEADPTNKNGDKKTYKLMEDMSKLNIFKDPREISKPMTMITNYLAGRTTAIAETAKELRSEITGYLVKKSSTKEGINYIRDLLKSDKDFYAANKKVIDKGTRYEIANLPGLNRTIEKYLKKNLVDKMRDYIEEENKAIVGSYQQRVLSMYSVIEKMNKLVKENSSDPKKENFNTILPPLASLTLSDGEKKIKFSDGKEFDDMYQAIKEHPKYIHDKEFIKKHKENLIKYGMPLTSKRQTMYDVEGGSVVTLNEVQNSLTSLVNTIHSIDAAIDYLAHESTSDIIDKRAMDYEHATEGDDVYNLELASISRKNSSGLIHDQNRADPYFNLLHEELYKRKAVEVNMDYDIEEQLMMLYAIHADIDAASSEFNKSNLTKYAKDVYAGIEKKQIALEDINIDNSELYGFGNYDDYIQQKNEEVAPEPQEVVSQEAVNSNNTDGEIVFAGKSITDLKKTYTKMKTLLKKLNKGRQRVFAYDTETLGMVFDGNEFVPAKDGRNIKPSPMHEIAFHEVLGTGSTETAETKTFYFDNNDPASISPEAIHATLKDELLKDGIITEEEHGMETKDVIFNNETAEAIQEWMTDRQSDNFAEQLKNNPDLKTNKDVMKAVTSFAGENAITAYNAGFDSRVLDMSSESYNKGGESIDTTTTNEYDMFHALLYKRHEDTGHIPQGKGLNTLSAMYENVFGKKPDGGLHTAAYDTQLLAELTTKMNEVGSDPMFTKTEDKSGENTSEPINPVIDENSVKPLLDENQDNPIINWFSKAFPNVDKIIKYGEENKWFGGTNTIEIVKDKTYNGLSKSVAVAHEIVHYATAAYMNSHLEKDMNVRYLSIFTKQLQTLNNRAKLTNYLESFSDDLHKQAMSRIDYALSRSSHRDQIAELEAIMIAEPDTAAVLYDAFGEVFTKPKQSKITKVIDGIWNSTQKQMNSIDFDDTAAIVNNDEVDIEMLKSAIHGIMIAGSSYVETNPDEAAENAKAYDKLGFEAKNKAEADAIFEEKTGYETNKVYKKKDDNYFPIGEAQWNMFNDTMGLGTQRFLENFAEPATIAGAKKADKFLMKNSGTYRKNKKVLEQWWYSNMFESHKGFLQRSRSGDTSFLNSIEAQARNVEKEIRAFENEHIAKMKNQINKARKSGKKLTKEDIKDLHRVSKQVPLFHLVRNSIMFKTIMNSTNPKQEIDNRIIDIAGKLSSKLYDDSVGMARVLARKQMLTTDTKYNIEQLGINSNDKTVSGENVRELVEELVALETLRIVDGSDNAIQILQENKNLADNIRDTSVGLHRIAESVLGGRNEKFNFPENLVMDQFENTKEFRSVDQRNIDDNIYKREDGWKILRDPSNKTYGVVWRDRSQVTKQDGAGTTTRYNHYDIPVGREIKRDGMNNAISVYVGGKVARQQVILTQEELDSFDDLITNPADSLTRSYAQFYRVKETQNIRDKIVYSGKINVLRTVAEATGLNRKLKKQKVENRKWFIKIPKGQNVQKFLDANPEVAKYYKEPEYISKINDFDKKFDLVRKDMDQMIMGYSDIELGGSSATVKKLFFLARKLATMWKIHITANNPKKIAFDIVSNNIILLGYGVPIADMAKDQIASVGLAKKMSKMRTDYVILEFERHRTKDVDQVRHDQIVKKQKILIKRIKKHAFAPMVYNGMIQSLSTEILNRDDQVISGLQHDIEKIFNHILKDDKGKSNNLEKGIKWFTQDGVNIDGLVKYLGESLQNIDAFDGNVKAIGEAMDKSASRIKDKRNSDDMAKYLSEFVGSPASEITKFGSYITQLADVAARYTLYKHLKQKGRVTDPKTGKTRRMTEEEIVDTVLEAFIDYKVNMPKSMKVLSDYTIVNFPSFTTRTHKVIYALVKKSPAKVAAGITMNEIFGINMHTYYDSTIFAQYGHIFNQPAPLTNPIETLFPSDLFEQATPFL